MKPYNLCGIAYEAVGKLRDMHQSVLMNAYVNECPEVGDVGDDARQHHPFAEVVHGVYIPVKLECLYLLARVTARFLKFFYYIS